MRRLFAIGLAAVLFFSTFPTGVFASAKAGGSWLDKSRLEQGAVGIEYAVKKDKLTKVQIRKDKDRYIYTLRQGEDTAWLPLQMGDGIYEIALLEQLNGNKYRVVAATKVDVTIPEETDVFLNSVQHVNWESAEKTAEKAEELIRGTRTDQEKLAAIYDFVVNHVSYDHELAETVAADYMPEIDKTLESGKGICYDYAVLTAAMLRQAGIPAKLVMGTTEAVDEYHAWNEVYLDGKWIVIDTTVDAAWVGAGHQAEMVKNSEDYKAEKVY